MQHTQHRSLAARLVLGIASLIALPALAGEIKLFEHSRFRGRSETYFNQVPDLAQMRFANEASSLIIKQGTWELCSQPNFRGDCQVYEPGEYSQIDNLNDRVRSIRELSRRPNYQRPPESYPSQPAPSHSQGITIYEHGSFGGKAVSLNGPVPDLGAYGMNNMVSSLIVRGEPWELCTRPNYGPPCRRFNRGDHDWVGDEFNDRFSSARPVRYANEGSSGWGPASGWNGGGWNGSRGRVVLYEYGDFVGRSYTVVNTINSLADVGFNDKASSVVIESGTWEFCTDAFFKGTCRTVGPGRYGSLPREMDSKISSVRQVGR